MKLEFICTVKSASATSVGLRLNDRPIDLVKNGDTWSGKSLSMVVSNAVQASFFAKGFQGTEWALELAISCPQGDPQKIFSLKGVIPSSGISKRSPSVKLPEKPCSDLNKDVQA